MIYTLDDLEHISLNTDTMGSLYLDVGTAIDAPHSSAWILRDENCQVIGIEPNNECLEILKSGRPPADFHCIHLDESAIYLEGEKIKEFNNEQFMVINCAIDDVETPTTMDFYHTDARNLGCSSLLKPTAALGLDVDKVSEITVTSLEHVLDTLDLSDIEEIKFVKTDTQGKDFDVVRSLGKYLTRVVGLKCEYNVANQYENSNSRNEFIQYMNQKNFDIVHDSGYDIYFFNTMFSHTYSELEVELLFTTLPKL